MKKDSCRLREKEKRNDIAVYLSWATTVHIMMRTTSDSNGKNQKGKSI